MKAEFAEKIGKTTKKGRNETASESINARKGIKTPTRKHRQT